MTHVATPKVPDVPRARWLGRTAVGVALAGTAALAAASGWPGGFTTRQLTALGMSEPGTYPVVRAAVNEHLGRVTARSTYAFNFASVSDNTPALITTPVVFEYDGGAGGTFRLPPARFVSIGQYGGWAYDYTIVTQLEAAPLADAYSAATAVYNAVAGAPRWRRLSGAPPALDSLRSEAAGGGWQGAGLGRWRLGTTDLQLNLKAGPEAGTYLVEVRIFDGSHDLAYLRRTYAIRRARQHGNEQDQLPLTEVLNDPTPVPAPLPQDSPLR